MVWLSGREEPGLSQAGPWALRQGHQQVACGRADSQGWGEELACRRGGSPRATIKDIWRLPVGSQSLSGQRDLGSLEQTDGEAPAASGPPGMASSPLAPH